MAWVGPFHFQISYLHCDYDRTPVPSVLGSRPFLSRAHLIHLASSQDHQEWCGQRTRKQGTAVSSYEKLQVSSPGSRDEVAVRKKCL